MADNRRDLALFDMTVDRKLRDCDLVCLKIPDAFAAKGMKERASVIPDMTGKSVCFEMTETSRQSLQCWITGAEMLGREYL